MILLEKTCSKCHVLQPAANFSKSKKVKSGLLSTCKKCDAVAQSIYWKKVKADPKRHAESRRKDHALFLKRRYNLQPEEYQRILIAQNGLCAICKGPETKKIQGILKALSTDHDHLTGKVGGLLCSECNIGLGKFRDNVLFLRQAALYLETSNKPHMES